MRLFGSMKIENNMLYIGNINIIDIAKQYGTPLYVLDEGLIRENCRRFKESFTNKGYENKVAYAGKAFLTLAMCKLIEEEGLYLDVVSGGELYTAYKSGFPMERIYFHGNNKTEDEISLGISLKVKKFVVDNFYEIEKINELAKKENRIQEVLLRVTPGIKAHTHHYIMTGDIDSKFGFSIINEEVLKAVKRCIELPNISLKGLHAHIGSQIFEIEPYDKEVSVMFSLIKSIKDKLNYEIEELDLGGGFGIYYKEGDNPKAPEEFTEAIIKKAIIESKRLNVKLPALVIEPGRSIVGNAGITLYTIGAMKEIPGVRKYISVDGGMSDNIRPALYNAEYQCMVGNRARANEIEKEKVTIAGKCCESGDILVEDITLPVTKSGDILTVFSTGAYGYSMSSNYNKIRRAAVVFVNNGKIKLVCKRQSYEDMIREELIV